MHNKTVILGGGFAGLQAARALSRAGRKVLLLDPSTVTTMLPALPDVAGGWVPEPIVQRPLRELLPAGIEHRPEAANAIHLDSHTVEVGGKTLDYDQLLIAAGSTPDYKGTPFPRDRLHVLGSLADALRIRTQFAAYLRTAAAPHILVAGTGYTGLELAMSLHFRAQAEGKACATTLVDPNPILLPSLPEPQRQYVMNFLLQQGVNVRLGVPVESFDGRDAVVGDQTLEDVFFCWAVGSTLAVREITGQVDRLRDGRMKVAPDLSLPQYPNVFVAGDSAAIERDGQWLRKAVNFAYYGGNHAGRNMARRMAGRPTRPFRPMDLGWIVPFHSTSIGRLPGNLWVRGGIGVRLHHLMCGIRNYSFRNFAGCVQLALNPYKKGNPT